MAPTKLSSWLRAAVSPVDRCHPFASITPRPALNSPQAGDVSSAFGLPLGLCRLFSPAASLLPFGQTFRKPGAVEAGVRIFPAHRAWPIRAIADGRIKGAKLPDDGGRIKVRSNNTGIPFFWQAST